jgi:GAF domain-containing protein
VTQRREVLGVSPGAARSIQRDADRERVEDLAHDRLLDLEQLVSRPVVRRRPLVIDVPRGDRPRFGPGAERVGRLEQLTDLAESRKRELAVVGTGERPQKRDALQADEVGKRMLIDRACLVVMAHF